MSVPSDPRIQHLREQARVLSGMSEVPGMLNLAQQAAEIANTVTDKHVVNEALLVSERWFGYVAYHRGLFSDSLTHFKKALVHAEEHGDEVGIATDIMNLANAENALGDLSRSYEMYHRALAIQEAEGDADGITLCLMNIGGLYASLADYASASESWHRALSVAEKHDLTRVAIVLCNLGFLNLELADFDSAMKYLKTAQERSIRDGSVDTRALICVNMGECYQRTGDLENAESLYKQALELFRSFDSVGGVIMSELELCSVYIERGQLTEAHQLIDPISASSIEDFNFELFYYYQMSRLAELEGNTDEAIHWFEVALDRAQDPSKVRNRLEIHKRARNLAKRTNTFKAYFEHSTAFEDLTIELHNSDQQRRLKLAESERSITEESRKADAERARAEERDKLLSSILPHTITSRLLAGERMIADAFDDVSILFLDLVNFTAIAARVPPKHLVHLLNEIFAACDDVIRRHGMTKIKTIGDAYLAAAGVPEPITDHVARCAAAAVELQQRLETLRISMPENYGDKSWIDEVGDINVRIGLHCGSVVAGVIGNDRVAYDIWGDAVNIASRMEQTSVSGCIHVSDSFARAIPDIGDPTFLGEDVIRLSPLYQLRMRGDVEVKGKGIMKTYYLSLNSSVS